MSFTGVADLPPPGGHGAVGAGPPRRPGGRRRGSLLSFGSHPRRTAASRRSASARAAPTSSRSWPSCAASARWPPTARPAHDGAGGDRRVPAGARRRCAAPRRPPGLARPVPPAAGDPRPGPHPRRGPAVDAGEGAAPVRRGVAPDRLRAAARWHRGGAHHLRPPFPQRRWHPPGRHRLGVRPHQQRPGRHRRGVRPGAGWPAHALRSRAAAGGDRWPPRPVQRHAGGGPALSRARGGIDAGAGLPADARSRAAGPCPGRRCSTSRASPPPRASGSPSAGRRAGGGRSGRRTIGRWPATPARIRCAARASRSRRCCPTRRWRAGWTCCPTSWSPAARAGRI